MVRESERFNRAFNAKIARLYGIEDSGMGKGIDGTADCTHIAAEIKAAGYSFVCRYYSHSPWKNLSRDEAIALSKAGLFLVSVWETNPTFDGYFDHAQGVKDGQAAYAFAQAVGQPQDAPIYFAVDYDAGVGATAGVIADYFRGVHEVLAPAHCKVGVYGSGLVCGHILDAGYASFAWLANAGGWRGTPGFTRWNIKQLPAVTVGGHSFDADLTNGNGGGFQVRP